MNTSRDNEKATSDFRFAMLEKLNANNHKKHWSEASVGYLFERLLQERRELEMALLGVVHMKASKKLHDLEVSDAMRECADVANMAMMIWDNLRHGIIEGSTDSEYLEPKK